MSAYLNYALLDEVWNDYKYPTNQTQQFSKSGYNSFDDYEYNEKINNQDTNKQGQAVLNPNTHKIYLQNHKNQINFHMIIIIITTNETEIIYTKDLIIIKLIILQFLNQIQIHMIVFHTIQCIIKNLNVRNI